VFVGAQFRDGMLEVRIVDEGPGLPEHVAALINADRALVPRGTGLGLWTAVFLSRRMSGTLRQETRTQGTCLVLTLSCQEVQDAAVAA
jgi:signal transduction histidine kinase